MDISQDIPHHLSPRDRILDNVKIVVTLMSIQLVPSNSNPAIGSHSRLHTPAVGYVPISPTIGGIPPAFALDPHRNASANALVNFWRGLVELLRSPTTTKKQLYVPSHFCGDPARAIVRNLNYSPPFIRPLPLVSDLLLLHHTLLSIIPHSRAHIPSTTPRI